MIRHLFKIIWNERSANTWIILEYVLVFCILWFCCDYLYYIGKSYYEPFGFDINYTYSIQMTEKIPGSMASYPQLHSENDDEYNYALELIKRLKQYPGIESACLSSASMPYSNSVMSMGYIINDDSLSSQQIRVRYVSSEFFDIFRIKLQKGRVFDWTDPAEINSIIITPDRNGYFGDPQKAAYPIFEVSKIGYRAGEDSPHTIIGITEKLKNEFFSSYTNTMFIPLEKWRVDVRDEVIIRIHPDAAKGFEERFTKDMKNQLIIGPYTFSNITSLQESQKRSMRWSGITNNLNSIYAITLFLIINIFLGIIGTFWYRTESRVSEIGLRIALGASKWSIKTFLYTETILILLISSIIGVNICINIGQTDWLSALGVPKADHIQIGSGIEQYFINFGLTFLFLTVVSLLAVWYPARQASGMTPAEALLEE